MLSSVTRTYFAVHASVFFPSWHWITGAVQTHSVCIYLLWTAFDPWRWKQVQGCSRWPSDELKEKPSSGWWFRWGRLAGTFLHFFARQATNDEKAKFPKSFSLCSEPHIFIEGWVSVLPRPPGMALTSSQWERPRCLPAWTDVRKVALMICLLYLWKQTSVSGTEVTFHSAAPRWALSLAQWWRLSSLRFYTEWKGAALMCEEFGNPQQGRLGDWQNASLGRRCLPPTPVSWIKDSLDQQQKDRIKGKAITVTLQRI